MVRFDTDRGFGFIRSPQTGADVFFHVKDFRSQDAASPRIGMPVSFEEIHVGGKGPRAMAVRAAGEDRPRAEPGNAARTRRTASRPRAEPASSSGAWLMAPLLLAYAGAVAWGVSTHRLPWWVLVALPGLNLATFLAYWQDKYAAQQDQWRVAENTLHLWSFAGGWIGAWAAQRLLRHKTRKASFLGVFRFSVFAHCAALAAWLRWGGA